MTAAAEGPGVRRASGSLEHEVLAVLRSSDGPRTPGEVRRALVGELAYTTVMTTLVRLHAKGLVQRVRSGRAYAYSPVERADEHAAQAMSDVLSRGANPHAVLTHFVERLSADEEALLRRLLDRAQDG